MRALGASRTSVVAGGVLAGNWSRDPLWRNARAVPSLDLRFADNKSLTDAKTGASLVTFTRASTATYVGSNGLVNTATTNEARFDHNPTTGESLGLLVEEARTNLLLNSATLSTQSATVTAVAHTLHFTGTGTITLTGVSTAGPLVGTGAGEANRVSLTFTPTAGSLTLTVSGTVTNAQLEAGAFPTSYIATTGATATRAADVASITGANFSSWYRQDEGTLLLNARDSVVFPSSVRHYADLNPNTLTATIGIIQSNSGYTGNGQNIVAAVAVSGAVQAAIDLNAQTTEALRAAVTYKANNFSACRNGVLGTPDTSGSLPTPDRLSIGSAFNSTRICNSTIARITYWPQALPSRLQSITQ